MAGWTLANGPLSFRGLPQSSLPFAVPLGLTSTIFASKLVAHNLHSRSIPQVAAIGAALAVGTLFPDVLLAPPRPVYHDYSATTKDNFGHKVLENRFIVLSAVHSVGLGIANAGLYLLGHNTLRHQNAESGARMHPNPTASRSGAIISFNRRSSLRSNCPPGECTANAHPRRGAARRNARNAQASGSGSGGDGHRRLPVEIVGKPNDGMFQLEYRILGGRGYEEPPPPPPPPPPPTPEDDDDNSDPRSGSGSLLAFLAAAAVCGLLTRITIKHRRIPDTATRYCALTAISPSPKLGYTFAAPNTASLNIPFDCGPDGSCIIEDYMVERTDIAPFSHPVVVEYAPCPSGYAEVRFKDPEPHQMSSGFKLDSRPAMRRRPAFQDWRNFLKEVAVSQFKFLKFGLLGLAVVMGALLSLSFIATLYRSFGYREKQAKPCEEPPAGPCTDIKCTEESNADTVDDSTATEAKPCEEPAVSCTDTEDQRSDGQSNADTLGGSIATEDLPIEVPVEASAYQEKQVVVAVENPSGLDNDRHADLSVRTEGEASASSTSLTLIHATVPVVEKQHEWCLNFEEFGHPLFESSVVNFDALEICATEPFYEEDYSFNLDDALESLKFDFTEDSPPRTGTMINTIEHETEAESLSMSNVIDDIHAPFDGEGPPVKLDTEEHQTEGDTSIAESSLNIDDIYVPCEEPNEERFTPHGAQTARFVEIEPVMGDDVAADTEEHPEEHQTVVDTSLTESNFNNEDIYAPFEEHPEEDFTPHGAQTARFVEIEPLMGDDVAAHTEEHPEGHQTVADTSLTESNFNNEDIYAPFEEHPEENFTPHGAQTARFVEIEPLMGDDVAADTEEHPEEHQTVVDTSLTESNFNNEDVYAPFEEHPEENFTPHGAQTARFVEIEPFTGDDVAVIGFDAPVGEALMDTSQARTDDESEAIVVTGQEDPFRIPTSDSPTPVCVLNPLAEAFVPELFPFWAPNSLEFDNNLVPDTGNEERGYRRRHKRPKKKKKVAEADCSVAIASTSA